MLSGMEFASTEMLQIMNGIWSDELRLQLLDFDPDFLDTLEKCSVDYPMYHRPNYWL